ncbi:uncharacterized protein LOC129947199 [Eupeodes corollae]|uniref:uncharacterized protein LOC129947199 n=1 Tax=Eupeodes corollae TaxID=290404 RepID=UPI00248FE05F|nr:uncharacterized protein LOC129947199 [Eupeodes corollae]XP_055913628.1 uncharacterized protein LOC129947199 [Eupeodes corollae]
MMTENLTEFPPYQPQNLPENSNAGQTSGPSIILTQKNPLDLTRKIVENQVVSQRVLTQDTSETPKQQQQDHPSISTAPKRDVPIKQQQPKPKKTSLSIPKEPMIDLTEEHPIQINRENIFPQIIEQASKPKSPVHVSKWLKFLPTQQRPKIPKRLFRETSASSAAVVGPSKDSTSLKNSIIRLYRDLPPAATSSLNTLQKTPTASCSKKSKNIPKQNPPQIAPQTIQKCQKPFRNTETMIPRERDLPRIPPRNAQTETNEIISPDFLLDEFLDLNESDMNDSGTSLTPSLKEGFRKIFGTDKLNEVFGGGDEVVYELTENHIIRLANALNMERGDLRQIIDNILSDENYGVIIEDGNIPSDSSSIVECSQSPPQRLFPSQRSQTSDGR